MTTELSDDPAVNPKAVKGQHIFPANRIKKLALQWKELNEAGKSDEAMPVLEEIIILSTEMFQRLAQHEKFHYTVDLDTLVAAAQEKVVKWLIRWEPKKGEIFSWFSKCAKNAFRSEVVKTNQFRKRYHTTGENLEKFFGSEDHEVDRNNVEELITQRIEQITCRWGCEQEKGVIRFHIACIMAGLTKNKAATIRSGAYAYGVSFELSKFFYSWALYQLRNVFLDLTRVPVTEQDLVRMEHHNDLLVDLLDIVTWQQLRKIIATMGGNRIKIPTIAQLEKLKQRHRVYVEIESSDLDPDSVADVAGRNRVSKRSAQEIFEEMSEKIDSSRFFEEDLYDEEHRFSF